MVGCDNCEEWYHWACVGIKKDPEEAYAQHCRDADIMTAPLRDCLSYYNGDGKAEPGSLAYYGGPRKWHDLRIAAQATLEPYVFQASPSS